MLAPLRFSSLLSPLRNASAPASPRALDAVAPSKRLASVSSSTGYACSLRSYLRASGRIISAPAWCALSITACILRGSSKLIAMIGLSLEMSDSDNDDAFGDTDGPQVPVPTFDRVFLRVAVAAEQLHAVQSDLHAF